MPVLDSGSEFLGARMPLIMLIGLFVIPWEGTLTTTVQKVALTPGQAILEDTDTQLQGRNALDCAQGDTIAASSEYVADVVVYWNPDVAGTFVQVVKGAEVLTSVGAVGPTDTEIQAALPNTGFTFARCGRVKFKRDSGTVVTMAYLDMTVRPVGVDAATKGAPAAAYQELEVVGADRNLYEFSHRERFAIDAADITAADVLTNKPVPPFYGKIGAWRYMIEKAITTGAKTATPNLEIGTTDVTGSNGVAIAGALAKGVNAELGLPTAGNTFVPGDTWSIEAATVTAFVEGRIAFEVDFYRLVTA